MARHHATPEGNMPFTPEEEALAVAAEAEWEAGALQRAKDNKCQEIDTSTQEAIIAIVGSDVNQRNLMAKHQDLLDKKIDGTITSEESAQAAYLKNLWSQVETLRDAGNANEEAIQNLTTIEEVENA